jgi:hypothetical protein
MVVFGKKSGVPSFTCPLKGEIAKNDLLIPFNAVDQHKYELPDDKDTNTVMYRMIGLMEDIVAGRYWCEWDIPG